MRKAATPYPARSRHPRYRRSDRQPETPHPAPRHLVGGGLDQHHRRGAVQGPRGAAVPDRERTGVRVAIGEPGRASRDFAAATSRHSMPADRPAGRSPRGQHHPLRRHRLARTGHREYRARSPFRRNGSWVAWRRGMTPPAGWPQRCAPTSTRTAAAAAPHDGSIHENTVAYRLRQAEEPRAGRWKTHPRTARRARPGRTGRGVSISRTPR